MNKNRSVCSAKNSNFDRRDCVRRPLPNYLDLPLAPIPLVQTKPYSSLVARDMHSRSAALNRCHCELQTDGNEASLQSGSPAAVACTQCQGVMTAQQEGTQRHRRQPTPSPHTHTHTYLFVLYAKVQGETCASRNVEV